MHVQAKAKGVCDLLTEVYQLPVTSLKGIVMAFTLNGIGTTYYGERWLPEGGYITTEWIVLCFVPIIPLESVRVIKEDPESIGVGLQTRSFTCQPAPLDVEMVLSMYAKMAAAIIFVIVANWVVERL